MAQKQNLELKVQQAWSKGLDSWSNPQIPQVITAKNQKDIKNLGEIGEALQGQYAFMKYPEFQTYVNLQKITETFKDESQKALEGIASHEIGHRFCPYDSITMIILDKAVRDVLKKVKVPYDAEQASHNIINLFSDMCINTAQTRRQNQSIPFLYEFISKDKNNKKSKLWNVYAKSMEVAWNKKLLPSDSKLTPDQLQAAQNIAELFSGDYFNINNWEKNIAEYTRLIAPFLENNKNDSKKSMSKQTSGGNMPKKLDKQTQKEIAKRLTKTSQNGTPICSKENKCQQEGFEKFKGIMASFGVGNPVEASILYYDLLSDQYDISFTKTPFASHRQNPFQPTKWHPSSSVDSLDVPYSVQTGGRLIPGINTHAWNYRKRPFIRHEEKSILDLDLYLDSSGSMPNPVEQVSLPVLASFVAAKAAHQKGVKIRATNFSGSGQYKTQDYTTSLPKIFEVLVTYFGGGTVFPENTLIYSKDPRQSLIITDAEIANGGSLSRNIENLLSRNQNNKVSIYQISDYGNTESFKDSGAEIITGNTHDIFNEVIGKMGRDYTI